MGTNEKNMSDNNEIIAKIAEELQECKTYYH